MTRLKKYYVHGVTGKEKENSPWVFLFDSHGVRVLVIFLDRLFYVDQPIRHAFRLKIFQDFSKFIEPNDSNDCAHGRFNVITTDCYDTFASVRITRLKKANK